MSKLLCFNFFFRCRVTNLLISEYVDSHLRPFRCKVKSCEGVQFSSTACLLRHEREAHGMHGHGSKPHLCTYADCERSLPNNGFPRQYSLFDHMKRVHDYTGSTSPPEQVPPPVQPAQPGPKCHNSTHKRKPAPLVEDITKKRQKPTTAKAPSAATAAASTHAAVDACGVDLWREEVSIPCNGSVLRELERAQNTKNQNRKYAYFPSRSLILSILLASSYR